MLVDGVSAALFGVELLQLHVAAILSFYVLFQLATDRQFHVNFRLFLSCLVLRCFVFAANRSFLIVERICCIGDSQASKFFVFAPYVFFNLGRLGLLGTALERAAAAAWPAAYDRRASEAPVRVAILVVVVLVTFFVSAVQTWRFFPYEDWMTVVYFVLNTTFSSLVTLYLYLQCRQTHKQRHEMRLELSERMQTRESLAATRLFLPLSLHELMTSLVFAGLFIYSVCFTPFPYGTDTTKLSHAYDNLQAWQCLFSAGYLSIVLRRRRRHLPLMPKAGKDVSEVYFDVLNKQWN